jgi:sulfate-transporting ATPase
MTGGYVYYYLNARLGLWAGVSAAVAVACVGLLSLGVQVLVLQHMRTASALSRVVVTLGMLVALSAGALLCFGSQALNVNSLLPTNTIKIFSGSYVGVDRLTVLAIGGVVTAVLWAIYKWSSFGRMTTAIAENPRVLASTGHSPALVAGVNWLVGGLLAGLAGVLIAPITGLDPSNLPLVVLPGLAAAVLGSFASFPIALAASLAVGVAEAEVLRFVSTPGWSDSVPFILVVGYLVVRGRGLPLRSYTVDRLPKVGTGRIRVIPVVVSSAAVVFAIVYWLNNDWLTAVEFSLAMSLVSLSVVVLTGYAGQISLAQYVLGGTGALVAARLSSAYHWDFALLLLISVAVTVVLGLFVGIPSLRTRGVNLAIATLGLAEVLYQLVLTNYSLAGGLEGINVASPTFLGWNIDPFLHQRRYAIVCLGFLVVVALMTANLRRGAAGRRLLAVRSSERAAAALGVSVYGSKLFAFGLASAYAALSVTLIAFMNPAVVVSQFDPISSISVVTATVIGGVGLIMGGLLGGVFGAGGLGTRILQTLGIDNWLALISGLSTIAVMRSDQDGVVEMNAQLLRRPAQRVRRLLHYGSRPARRPRPAGEPRQVEKKMGGVDLRVDHLSIRFGGVVANDNVSLRVRPGTIHGVIGPNGAGKTTAIDGITGFVSPSQGRVFLDERDITRWGPTRRSRAGLRRSFQSDELFSDLTVRENIALGCDDGSRSRFLTDLVHPGPVVLSGIAQIAIREFALTEDLDRQVWELPLGRRRLVSIARAVASGPAVLLLDEPASGLDAHDRIELARLVRDLVQRWDIGVLLVEHDVDLVWSLCDEVTVLANGRVICEGPVDTVRNSAEVRRVYMGEALDADEQAPAPQIAGE